MRGQCSRAGALLTCARADVRGHTVTLVAPLALSDFAVATQRLPADGWGLTAVEQCACLLVARHPGSSQATACTS